MCSLLWLPTSSSLDPNSAVSERILESGNLTDGQTKIQKRNRYLLSHWDIRFDIIILFLQGENIFSWYSTDLLPPHYADTYGGRIQHLRDGSFGLGRGSINLTSIRETDHGLYHCMVSFPNRTPPTRNNGTFYYLEVEGKVI